MQNCTVLYKFMARAKDLGRGKTTQAFYRFDVHTSKIDRAILDRDELRYTELTEVLGSPYYSQASKERLSNKDKSRGVASGGCGGVTSPNRR